VPEDPLDHQIAWVAAGSAAPGVAAHFLNRLPDLADDESTGIRGLPHRIGGQRSQASPSRVVNVILLALAAT
jgi:4-hydroxybenzoate polyprenyltransferase